MAAARLGLVGAALAAVALQAHACRCPEAPSPAAAYGRADSVLLGEVLQVDPDKGNGESSATFRVAQSWKTQAAGEVTVFTRTTCAVSFSLGGPQLLYVFRDPKRHRLETRQCMGNAPAAQADKALRWLDKRGRPASGTSR